MTRAAALTPRSRHGAAHLPDAPPDGWTSLNLDAASADLADRGVPFTADELRDDRFGLDCRPNEVGSAFARAHHRGVVRPLGFRESRIPSRRGGVQRVWIGTGDAS